MNSKVRKVLLTIGFALIQIFGLGLFILGLYFLGHAQFALAITEVTGPNIHPIEYIASGFCAFFVVVFSIAATIGIGFLLHAWGKFTMKKATVWNTKINIKLNNWKENRSIRKASLPDWEV